MIFRCPAAECAFKGGKKDELVKHVRDKHPDVKYIVIGTETVKI